VDIPVAPIEPERREQKPADPRDDSIDLSRVISNQPPTILVAQDLSQDPPAFVIAVPTIDEGPGGRTSVAEAVTGARIKYSPEPPYPLISRAREEEGSVLLKIMVAPDGTAGDVQVETSSGFPRLDDAAMKAVRGWKFSPAKRGSQTIAAWVSVPVTFVLNGRG
jgi:protein TonB